MTLSLGSLEQPIDGFEPDDSLDAGDQSLVEMTDEELTAMALAADPDVLLDASAVPLTDDEPFPELLPSWYMPVPSARARKPWQKVAGLTVIMAFVIINALGCCITYGHLVAA